jgi:hypothetical protein
MLDNPAAIRASAPGQGDLFVNRAKTIGRHVGLNGFGHRVGAG